ncbi:hypothetical protein [Acinetobacter proteolyticus]|uniref:Uncharacterized protein n=1 Tax=Acinetobacter proteolyticus TaxID=1776741 RepID=A0A2N0WIE3_9GAMM|nr:hypothetical protein [Acinetobacter proteolyticus]PKF35572.1 hypothetical protein CW311_04595 [Acinetobacter proteolyticus]
MRHSNKLGQNNLYGAADFDFSFSDNGFLIIEDLDLDGPSVTNDMHNVLASLVAQGHNLHGLKVIYKDSCGIYDAVLIKPDNTMEGIASINAETLKEAFRRYDEKFKHQELIQHNSLNPC